MIGPRGELPLGSLKRSKIEHEHDNDNEHERRKSPKNGAQKGVASIHLHFCICIDATPIRSLKKIQAGFQETEPLIRWLRRLPKPVCILACNDARALQLLIACRSGPSSRVGYMDVSHMCRSFRRWNGMAPGQYRKQMFEVPGAGWRVFPRT